MGCRRVLCVCIDYRTIAYFATVWHVIHYIELQRPQEVSENLRCIKRYVSAQTQRQIRLSHGQLRPLLQQRAKSGPHA